MDTGVVVLDDVCHSGLLFRQHSILVLSQSYKEWRFRKGFGFSCGSKVLGIRFAVWSADRVTRPLLLLNDQASRLGLFARFCRTRGRQCKSQSHSKCGTIRTQTPHKDGKDQFASCLSNLTPRHANSSFFLLLGFCLRIITWPEDFKVVFVSQVYFPNVAAKKITRL